MESNMSNCIKCNGTMVGDGYTSVLHCEHATEDSYEYHEADASPVYCDYKDVEEHFSDLESVTSWHRNFITVDYDGSISAWDESQSNIINSDCSTVAKAVVILDEYALTLKEK